jgi:FkbM family methyltransferase
MLSFLNALSRRLLSPRLRFLAKHYVTRLRMRLGTSPSHGALDARALELLGDLKGGFYVEVGAADGVQWSNTLMLERRHGWRGLLIEPTRFQYDLCRNVRGARNIVENAALAAEPGRLSVARVGLASIVADADGNVKDFDTHIGFHRGDSFDADTTREETAAVTFGELARAHDIRRVDFFSMDVEGFELEALEGIDFDFTHIEPFVIETDDFDGVENALAATHQFVEKSRANDYFFRSI